MTANADIQPIDGERRHDPLCYVAQNGGTCCPWMGNCDCQCMCDYITEIRQDTLDMVEKRLMQKRDENDLDPSTEAIYNSLIDIVYGMRKQ